LNLVVNARDAMPAGGRVTIETSNVHLDDAYALPLGDVPPGAYVLLSVTDAGGGIPKDLLGRVFEPFFTTKAIGHGTGLGLPMVHGFVKQSGGHVRIYSEVGEGTTVKIYLRRSAAAGQQRTPWPTVQNTLPTGSGSETILVVDDDEGVRNYVQDALEDLGYRVLTASDAAGALTILKAEQTSRIDLLFTDVIMPGGVNGLALANQVAERWPNLPVLFTTGYSPGAFIGGDKNGSPVRFLGKPYSIDALARKVRETLDGTRRPIEMAR
jgi:CheY-like chemotaxis protein